MANKQAKPGQRSSPDIPPVSAAESFDSKDSEIVIGLVGPTGADIKGITALLKTFLEHPLEYDVEVIKITDLLQADEQLRSYVKPYNERDYNEKINALMQAGNDLRQATQRTDILALLAINHINEPREQKQLTLDTGEKEVQDLYKGRKVYIVHQFKHPDEVRTFRSVYGPGFYLLGVNTSYHKRKNRFTRMGVAPIEADTTLERDLDEDSEYGQHTRDTFALADAYVATERLPEEVEADVIRFLNIIFGDPYETPTRDEYCMFLAYAASFRSADLSRQVGAVLVSEQGDITATGSNEVAMAGGGQYWAGEVPRCRDCERSEDSNHRERSNIIEELVRKVLDGFQSKKLDKDRLWSIFRGSSVWGITEYGRSIHAEMEAILSCGRAGISTRGGVLYTTTFPCHNCAKHIVDAGIRRVVFVEPYPKSRAPELLSDSILVKGEQISQKPEDHACIDPNDDRKVVFEPFIGVSARKFVDLFSVHLTTGRIVKRKDRNGRTIPFSLSAESNVKVAMMPSSYLDRERIAGYYYSEAIERLRAMRNK